MIRVKILADSVNTATDDRLTTFLLVYPRFIHSEIMTHRAFSRNAASSRAIPVERMLVAVMEEPAMPVAWGSNQPGMQAGAELEGEALNDAQQVWWSARADAVQHARKLIELGVHKQIANRVLEPFAHMTTLVSATDWLNFFTLRAHSAADPTFQALAYAMLEAYLAHAPAPLGIGEWHMPYGDQMPAGATTRDRIRIAVARCARISYLRQDGVRDLAEDVALHDRLAESGHWSPFEHVASAMSHRGRSGNFRGWQQYRQMMDHHQYPMSRANERVLLQAILDNYRETHDALLPSQQNA